MRRFLTLLVIMALLAICVSLLFYPNPIMPVAISSRNGKVSDQGLIAAPWDSYRYNVDLMARVIQSEAWAEPYVGKVAIGAVIMNRLESPNFPKTIPGVIFEPDAFESVSNGLIWLWYPSADAYRATQDALSGWDPTGGALYYFNPSKPVSWWIWTRPIITQIGNHVFSR
ncbi:MAG TPA: spore cortex-lytic protein [Firmicutes bacterium]|nr:spore cortex-lytic protein [Bacillota bacterium]